MKRPAPVNEEVLFDGRSLISETDTKGIITYLNRKFTEMTGYIPQPKPLDNHTVYCAIPICQKRLLRGCGK